MPTSTRRQSRARRAVIAGLALLLLGAATMACRVPRRYDVTPILGGLHSPWEVAFAPDGSMFVTERPGDIGVFRNGQYMRFNRPGDVVAIGEGGMMGLAVDPNFGTNSRIYTCYLTASDVRVVRWQANLDTVQLSSPLPVVTEIPRSSNGRHSGCRLAFSATDPGVLWVTTGDAAQCRNSQNPRTLGGKVLRVTTTGGTPAGNLGGPFLPQIYAFGFRNPQGLSFRADGRPLLVEHGPNTDDEITPLPVPGPPPANVNNRNGGWDPGCTYDEGVPMTDTNKFPGAMQPLWESGSPTIAPSGAAIVNDPDWGDRNHQLAVAVLKGAQLRMFNAHDGSQDQGAAVLTGFGRLRTAVQAPQPDGRLYIATDADPGQIIAVQPVL